MNPLIMKTIKSFAEFLLEKKEEKEKDTTKKVEEKPKDKSTKDEKVVDEKPSDDKDKKEVEVPEGIKGLTDAQKKKLSPGLQAAILKNQIKNLKKKKKE